MDVQEREGFAREWLRLWNERDLTSILSHYSDDVEFQSPVAVHLFGETFRMIRGKKALTDYFERACLGPGEDRVRIPGCLSRCGHDGGALSVKDLQVRRVHGIEPGGKGVSRPGAPSGLRQSLMAGQ